MAIPHLMESRRVDIRSIITNPALRRELMVRLVIATQAREGIVTTRAQAEAAYDAVRKERGILHSYTKSTHH